MRHDFIFTTNDTHNNSNLYLLTEFGSTHRSTNLTDTLPLKTYEKIRKAIPNHMRIVISCTMKKGASLFQFEEKSVETENTT